MRRRVRTWQPTASLATGCVGRRLVPAHRAIGYSFHPHQQSSVAFFPIYPMTVRAVGALLPGGVAFAAILVTVSAGSRLAAVPAMVSTAHVEQRRVGRRRGARVVSYAWFLYGRRTRTRSSSRQRCSRFCCSEDDRPSPQAWSASSRTGRATDGVVVLIGCRVCSTVVARSRTCRAAHGLGGGPRRQSGIVACAAGSPALRTSFASSKQRAPRVGTARRASRSGSSSTSSRASSTTRQAVDPFVAQALACGAFAAAIPAVGRRFGRGYAIYVAAAVACRPSVRATSWGRVDIFRRLSGVRAVGTLLERAHEPGGPTSASALPPWVWGRHCSPPVTCSPDA